MKKYVNILFICLVSFLAHANPLPAKEVFHFKPIALNPNTLILDWDIKSGYFIYKDRISLQETSQGNAHLGTVQFPESILKTDKLGKTYPIYRHHLNIPVAVLGENPGETIWELKFQGCSDSGFCYPPETRPIKLTIDAQLALTDATVESDQIPKPLTETQEIESIYHSNWALILLSFLGFGLLLSFTPCVLPMIPVLSGIIVGLGNTSTRRAFFLSLSYVLSMSITYALIGAIVALLGSNLQIVMQKPIIIALFSSFFILLAFSMFGFYDIKFPTTIQGRIRHQGNSSSKGYLTVILMGSLSTLILSPCVTAPLIGALGFIANTGNVFLGTLSLFFLGLGMGLPLLLIGTSAGKWLPKSGPWMEFIKVLFGFLLLGIAIFLLQRIVPNYVGMLAWACLFIIIGVYFAFHKTAFSSRVKLKHSCTFLLLFYGFLLVIGASSGNSNPLEPLKGLTSSKIKPSFQIKTVKSIQEIQKAILLAKQQNQPVMLDFYADWCTSCKIMEMTTFQDPQVQRLLKNFVILKVDITANDKEDKVLLKKFDVVAPPTFIFFNKQGVEQTNLKLVGETPTHIFLKQLTWVTALN